MYKDDVKYMQIITNILEFVQYLISVRFRFPLTRSNLHHTIVNFQLLYTHLILLTFILLINHGR